mgnify:CR=1 FL=1
MYDIIYIGDKNSTEWHNLKKKYVTAKCATDLINAKQKVLTKFFWIVPSDVELDNNFDFSYVPDSGSQNTVHVFLNGDLFDGVALLPKNKIPTEKEFKHRFYAEKKEVEIRASTPKPYDVFDIESYADYERALENTTTEMFWMSSPNISVDNELINIFYFSHHNTEDRGQNHAFIHKVNNTNYYNGLFLCSIHQPLTKNEVEHRFPVARREWDIVGSGPVDYDRFTVDSYIDYCSALENTSTEMFWCIPSDVIINKNAETFWLPNDVVFTEEFNFDYYFNFDNDYDRYINHVFLNGKYYDGIILCSKHSPVTKKEIEHRFLVNKKEHNVVASHPKPYDVFDIESYADYCSALENTTTEMFWMSSPNISVDEELINNFYFSHHNTEDRSQNHAFIHRVDNNDYYNGLFLCSIHQPLTKNEVEHRFPVARREWDIVGSGPIKYEIFSF